MERNIGIVNRNSMARYGLPVQTQWERNYGEHSIGTKLSAWIRCPVPEMLPHGYSVPRLALPVVPVAGEGRNLARFSVSLIPLVFSSPPVSSGWSSRSPFHYRYSTYTGMIKCNCRHKAYSALALYLTDLENNGRLQCDKETLETDAFDAKASLIHARNA